MQNFDQSVDARGLNCPLPIIKVRKALKDMQAGEVVQLLATDPGSTDDIESFCDQTGHSLLSSEKQGAEFLFMVRKN